MKQVDLIQHIISKGESGTVEFKNSFTDEAIESAVAFANSVGGTILIGITNNGFINGVTTGPETLQNWLNEIKNKTQPSIMPNLQLVQVEKRQLVFIQVAEFPVKASCF